MSSSHSTTILLVDYENVQNVDFSLIQDQDIEVKIFVGSSQNKIPFELVQSAQKLGSRIEWIRIEGSGNNALDFHVAFYLGKFSSGVYSKKFIILSKDKGFDPLVKYMRKDKKDCKRIQSLVELSENKDAFISKNSNSVSVVIENLSKIQKNKRPRTRKTLGQHIDNLLKQKKVPEQSVDSVVDSLFVQKKISENANHLSYNF